MPHFNIIVEFGPKASKDVPGKVQPLPEFRETKKYLERYRGIQGHYNSCYLDASLFCIFAFCDNFDFMLEPNDNKEMMENFAEAKKILRESIVNPLRK